MGNDEETAIRQMFVDMNHCFLQADFESRSKFLTADSLTLPQDAAEPLGREQMAEFFEQIISEAQQKSGVTLADFPIDELIICGDIAYVRVTYIASTLGHQSGEWSNFFKSRHFYIVRKEVDGEWRILRDMWSNVPFSDERL